MYVFRGSWYTYSKRERKSTTTTTIVLALTQTQWRDHRARIQTNGCNGFWLWFCRCSRSSVSVYCTRLPCHFLPHCSCCCCFLFTFFFALQSQLFTHCIHIRVCLVSGLRMFHDFRHMCVCVCVCFKCSAFWNGWTIAHLVCMHNVRLLLVYLKMQDTFLCFFFLFCFVAAVVSWCIEPEHIDRPYAYTKLSRVYGDYIEHFLGNRLWKEWSTVSVGEWEYTYENMSK